MTPANDDATRPRRDDELADQIVRQLRRLDSAIIELDDGDEYALDDIVIAIRSLAGQGKGNHTLTELARTIDDVPDLHPVSAPANDEPTITFATGALPVADTHIASSDQAPRSLGALMNLNCLTVTPPEDNQQRTYSWDQLVSAVANKLGAIHSDPNIPVAFDEIQRFETAGQPALVHALRNLAVVVSRHGHQLLDAANVEHGLPEPTHRIPAVGQMWVGSVQAAENRQRGGGNVTFTFDPNVPPPPPGQRKAKYPMASVPTRMQAQPRSKTGRNDPCPCGSGNKHKRCCGR